MILAPFQVLSKTDHQITYFAARTPSLQNLRHTRKITLFLWGWEFPGIVGNRNSCSMPLEMSLPKTVFLRNTLFHTFPPLTR